MPRNDEKERASQGKRESAHDDKRKVYLATTGEEEAIPG